VKKSFGPILSNFQISFVLGNALFTIVKYCVSQIFVQPKEKWYNCRNFKYERRKSFCKFPYDVLKYSRLIHLMLYTILWVKYMDAYFLMSPLGNSPSCKHGYACFKRHKCMKCQNFFIWAK